MSGSRRRLTGALACAAALGASLPAMAQGLGIQPYPAYPAVRTPDAVGQWITTMTDVPLNTVVGIGSDSVFSVEPGRQQVGSAIRVSIRQEAIDPDFTRRLGGRSAVMVVDLDCPGRKVFQRALALYDGSNRKGSVRHLGEGAAWRDVPRGSYMDAVVAAVCTPGYRPLFAQAPPPRAPAPVLAAAGLPMPTSAPAGPPASYPKPMAVAAAPALPAAPAYAPSPQPAPQPARRVEAAMNFGAFRRVEIGRFSSTTAALQAAQDLDQAFPGVMAGKQRRIELSTVGGRTEFRGLVEGFASPAEAEAFCRQLLAGGRACSGAS